MTSWHIHAHLDRKEYDVVEMFAGVSMVASTARSQGLSAAALDLEFDKVTSRPGAMDLSTPSGFALLLFKFLELKDFSYSILFGSVQRAWVQISKARHCGTPPWEAGCTSKCLGSMLQLLDWHKSGDDLAFMAYTHGSGCIPIRSAGKSFGE